MMSTPSILELQHDVLGAQREVEKLERVYGSESKEYRQALTQLARIWSVLRLKRSNQDFVKEVQHL